MNNFNLDNVLKSYSGNDILNTVSPPLYRNFLSLQEDKQETILEKIEEKKLVILAMNEEVVKKNITNKIKNVKSISHPIFKLNSPPIYPNFLSFEHIKKEGIVQKIEEKRLDILRKEKRKNNEQSIKNVSNKKIKIVKSTNASCPIDWCNFGLTLEEGNEINAFYNNNIETLQRLENPQHLRKKTDKNPCARSIIFVPQGPFKGFYILLKGKNTNRLGIGSFCTITKAIHFETGKVCAFRSGEAKNFPEMEIQFNNTLLELANKVQGLTYGSIVYYSGTCQSRRCKSDGNTGAKKQPNKVKKMGMIMEIAENGDLMDYLMNSKLRKNKLSSLNLIGKIINAIVNLHQNFKITHNDLKPENILLNYNHEKKEYDVKICDFSFLSKIDNIMPIKGTDVYMSPELWITAFTNKTPYVSKIENDMWALGVLLSIYGHTSCLINAILKNKVGTNSCKLLDNANFLPPVNKENNEEIFSKILKNKSDPTHLDYLIYQCLQFEPKNRPNDQKLIEIFEKIKTF